MTFTNKFSAKCSPSAFLLLASLATLSSCNEFTFELADNSEDCFYEEIKQNTTAYLEFQVTAGGQWDVNVTLKNPQGDVIYDQQSATFDSHQFVADTTGVYTTCFSNQFSSSSHKFVYVDFLVDEEPALSATVPRQFETLLLSLHKRLDDILNLQTYHRLFEKHGQLNESQRQLNKRIMWLSGIEIAAILLIGIGQVLILRSIFTERKSNQVVLERL